MKKIKIIIATIVCKLLIFAGRLMGKKGSYTPGVVAMKICPDILKYISSQVKGDIIFVCGTNGKTTTNNLICSLLEGSGKKVVCNKVGANMLAGVAVSFIEKANIFGDLDADFASIECDEASLRHAVNHVRADKVVITNLFRDQMDRYGEIDDTIALLNEALNKTPNSTLILNGDDPFCAQFGRGRKAIYFGVGEPYNKNNDDTNEGRFCVLCGAPLKYEYRHYSQLGKWECTGCDFKRPELNYCAKNIDLEGKMTFDINDEIRLDLNYRGFYNIYNVLAAYSAFANVDAKCDVNKVLADYKPQIGRMESFNIGGKQVVLNLAKNPAGFNQAIATVSEDKREKDILIAVNDRPSDGMDISWLYDVDFEKLKEANVKSVFVSGERKHDTALRLKYAGLETQMVDITAETIKKIAGGDGEVCYLLVNYTVLFATQEILKRID